MKRTFRFPALALGMLLTLAGAAPLANAAPPQSATLSSTVSVPTTQKWVDTGISVRPNVDYTVTATGVVSCHGPIAGSPCPGDANGINPSTGSGYGSAGVTASPFPCEYWGGTLHCWAAAGLPAFSLIGRIGTNGTPFLVGSGPTVLSGSGELYFTYNDWLYRDNVGTFTVTVATVLNISSCKNGAWENYGVFTNQGDCVSFVATGGKNAPGFDGKGK